MLPVSMGRTSTIEAELRPQTPNRGRQTATVLLFNAGPLFGHRFRILYGKGGGLHVVAPAEELFQPDVQANKPIAAPHFLGFHFGYTCSSGAPGNRDDGPGVTANDRFEGNLHREIEVRRYEGAAPIDHGFPVRFESVGRIV